MTEMMQQEGGVNSGTERKKAKELFGLMVKRLEMEKALYPIDKDKNELRPFFIAK